MELFSMTTVSYLGNAAMICVVLSMLGAFIMTKPDVRMAVFYYLFSTRLGKAVVVRERRADPHTHTTPLQFGNITVLPIAVLTDNYSYLVWGKDKRAIVIDVSDPAPIYHAVQQYQLNVVALLTTHHHWDHCAGNEELAALIPNMTIMGPRAANIPGCSRKLADKEQLQIGSLRIQALSTPCHTTTHMIYVVTQQESKDSLENIPLLFSGDCLFVAGCGKFFEGTPGQMYINLKLIRELPSSTRLFSGHEYAERNLKFVAKKFPKNTHVHNAYEQSKIAREQKQPFFTTLAEERMINPFLKWDEAEVQVRMGFVEGEDVIAELRRQRNGIRPTRLYDERLGRVPNMNSVAAR